MARIPKTFVMVVASALLMVVRFAGAASQPASGSGQQWMSWSPAQRNTYVHGFIAGYWNGSEATCKKLDQIFEVGQPHRVGDSSTARCENHLENYTKLKLSDSGLDVSAYTSVLTEFYTKPPEYQNIQGGYLLSLLTDGRYQTAAQLYQMAVKREIDTNFP